MTWVETPREERRDPRDLASKICRGMLSVVGECVGVASWEPAARMSSAELCDRSGCGWLMLVVDRLCRWWWVARGMKGREPGGKIDEDRGDPSMILGGGDEVGRCI